LESLARALVILDGHAVPEPQVWVRTERGDYRVDLMDDDGVVIEADGRVSEEGSLGEASSSCGEGPGDGIAPGAASWVSLELAPRRYELICNLPGHYAMGMFTELDVR